MIIRHLVRLILAVFENSPLGKSRRKQSGNFKSVDLPDYMIVVGVITIIFFLSIFVISLVYDAPVVISVLLALFMLLGVSLIIAWKNVRVLYNEDEIIQTTFWGKEKCFTYDEFVSYSENSATQNTKYYTADGRTLSVDQSAEEAIYLDISIKANYKKLHNNKNLPQK